MKRSIENDTRVRFVVFTTALAVAATLAPAFAQSSKIAQPEVRLEPAAPSPTAHDQFGFVTAMSANGQTSAIGATTGEGTQRCIRARRVDTGSAVANKCRPS